MSCETYWRILHYVSFCPSHLKCILFNRFRVCVCFLFIWCCSCVSIIRRPSRFIVRLWLHVRGCFICVLLFLSCHCVGGHLYVYSPSFLCSSCFVRCVLFVFRLIRSSFLAILVCPLDRHAYGSGQVPVCCFCFVSVCRTCFSGHSFVRCRYCWDAVFRPRGP